MRTEKIYLIRAQCGSYSDRNEWTVAAFSHHTSAEAARERLIADYERWNTEYETVQYDYEKEQAWLGVVLKKALDPKILRDYGSGPEGFYSKNHMEVTYHIETVELYSGIYQWETLHKFREKP